MEAYFDAVLDQQGDFSEAFTFLSDDCQEESSLLIFQALLADGPVLAEATFTVKDLRFVELVFDFAVVEPEMVITSSSGEQPVALNVEGGLVELIREDGQWRIHCPDSGADANEEPVAVEPVATEPAVP